MPSKQLKKRKRFSNRMDNKIPTGSKPYDDLLEGGYEKDSVTTLYGPAGSGKTTACILCSLEVSKDMKVIFVDTEGGFSVERAKQIVGDEKELKKRLEKIVFFHPTTFDDQKKTILQLPELMSSKIGLVVVDTFTMLYRSTVSGGDDVKDVNKDLAAQMAVLIRIARDHKIPVLMTSQVYSNFDTKNAVNIVGGDIVKYGSKCLIELASGTKGNRVAVLKKHRSIPHKEIEYEIYQKGFR